MDTASIIDNVLEHHGVKGQKWGVHRSRGVSKSKKNAVHPAHENAVSANQSHAKVKSSGQASLSNKELQELVTRMNLEKQYASLAANASPSTAAKGKKAVAAVLAVGATANAVVAFANSPAGKALGSSISKAVKK